MGLGTVMENVWWRTPGCGVKVAEMLDCQIHMQPQRSSISMRRALYREQKAWKLRTWVLMALMG